MQAHGRPYAALFLSADHDLRLQYQAVAVRCSLRTGQTDIHPTAAARIIWPRTHVIRFNGSRVARCPAREWGSTSCHVATLAPLHREPGLPFPASLARS